MQYEVFDAAETKSRFPTFTPGPEVVAFYENNAGFVRPEASVRAHLRAAESEGATLRFEEPVLKWSADPSGEGVRVKTARRTYQAGRLVVSTGPWAPHMLADMNLPLQVERLVQHWFVPEGGIESFAAERHPIYVWEAEDGEQFYGFPNHGSAREGVKVAFFRKGTPCEPETIDRSVYDHEVEQMRSYLEHRIPAVGRGEFLRAATCMYTNTPDEHFVISNHPDYDQVTVAAGFSGHGFKFASVVGEVLADLTTKGETAHSIELFDPARLAKAGRS